MKIDEQRLFYLMPLLCAVLQAVMGNIDRACFCLLCLIEIMLNDILTEVRKK